MNKHPWLQYKNWAVVGASTKHYRYGYKIVKELEEAGYNTLPITPKYRNIDGIKAYTDISHVEEGLIDVVNFVVNPSIGIHVLKECIRKGITRIWLQPGTVSEEILAMAKSHNIEVVEGCILVVLSW